MAPAGYQSCLCVRWAYASDPARALYEMVSAVKDNLDAPCNLDVCAFETMFPIDEATFSFGNAKDQALRNGYPILYSHPRGIGTRPAHFFDNDLMAVELCDGDIFRLRNPSKFGPEIFKRICEAVLAAAEHAGVWHPPMIAFV